MARFLCHFFIFSRLHCLERIDCFLQRSLISRVSTRNVHGRMVPALSRTDEKSSAPINLKIVERLGKNEVIINIDY